MPAIGRTNMVLASTAEVLTHRSDATSERRASTQSRSRFGRGTSPNGETTSNVDEEATAPFARVHSEPVSLESPSQVRWLGISTARPQFGEAIVIASGEGMSFTITSAVTKLAVWEDGVLVQTTTRSRYFVGNSGDVFLVRRRPGSEPIPG